MYCKFLVPQPPNFSSMELGVKKAEWMDKPTTRSTAWMTLCRIKKIIRKGTIICSTDIYFI